MKFFLTLFSLLILQLGANGQDSLLRDDTVDSKKLNRYILISSATYGAALVGLSQVWYSDHEKQSFHFFNDNDEWQQLDKAGHLYSAFHISQVGIKALKSTGLNNKKSYFWGGMLGVIVLTPIEVLDGFSAGYGASWGDMVANVSGAALAAGQYYAWNEIRIHSKYSFQPDPIANERPALLGDGFHEEMIKNYNGMTYWLSFDLYGLLNKPAGFPKWLNLAVGYGGQGMVSANNNASRGLGYDPYRQYFLSIDFDLTYIKSNSKLVNALLYAVNMIHLPAPALELRGGKGLKLHAFYF